MIEALKIPILVVSAVTVLHVPSNSLLMRFKIA
jgi:hypothetical protein